MLCTSGIAPKALKQCAGAGGVMRMAATISAGALLIRVLPVHVVAARCGHDPAVLLRAYAKRTRKADTSAAAVIGSLSKTILR